MESLKAVIFKKRTKNERVVIFKKQMEYTLKLVLISNGLFLWDGVTEEVYKFKTFKF